MKPSTAAELLRRGGASRVLHRATSRLQRGRQRVNWGDCVSHQLAFRYGITSWPSAWAAAITPSQIAGGAPAAGPAEASPGSSRRSPRSETRPDGPARRRGSCASGCAQSANGGSPSKVGLDQRRSRERVEARAELGRPATGTRRYRCRPDSEQRVFDGTADADAGRPGSSSRLHARPRCGRRA